MALSIHFRIFNNDHKNSKKKTDKYIGNKSNVFSEMTFCSIFKYTEFSKKRKQLRIQD